MLGDHILQAEALNGEMRMKLEEAKKIAQKHTEMDINLYAEYEDAFVFASKGYEECKGGKYMPIVVMKDGKNIKGVVWYSKNSECAKEEPKIMGEC